MTQPTPTGTGHVLALALVIVKRRSTRSELNLGMSVIGTEEMIGLRWQMVGLLRQR
jgi:hypothetical protein